MQIAGSANSPFGSMANSPLHSIFALTVSQYSCLSVPKFKQRKAHGFCLSLSERGLHFCVVCMRPPPNMIAFPSLYSAAYNQHRANNTQPIRHHPNQDATVRNQDSSTQSAHRKHVLLQLRLSTASGIRLLRTCRTTEPSASARYSRHLEHSRGGSTLVVQSIVSRNSGCRL